jgi:purine-binding chemotaxis protein CheW
MLRQTMMELSTDQRNSNCCCNLFLGHSILKTLTVVSDNLGRNVSQFVAFRIDSQTYAFRIEQIQEIVILGQVTRTPQVPDYVEGVANLRGSIIPIVNLRKLFGLHPKPVDADTRTIVVNVGKRTIGCTVDTVTQVVRIGQDAIHLAPDTVTSHGASYISGFARVQDQLIVLLEVDELLDPQKLEQVSKNAIPDIPSIAVQPAS